MDLQELKTTIQRHMSDGLVTIVGSGLSCAEGLPSMSTLAEHLEKTLRPSGTLATEWLRILPSLRVRGLEAALLETPPSRELEGEIRREVGNAVSAAEATVVAEVFNGKRTLRLTRLLRHLLMPSTGLHVVTTNYDRLIEVAAEEAGLGVDTMFTGVFAGKLNERETRLGFCREIRTIKKTSRLIYSDRVIVSKPHGSLDWWDRFGSPVRHCGELPMAQRLIIPPGQNKYQNGYSSPFDVHRERGNHAIDRASRFLIIGYGFNDVHLETHLKDRIRSGTPTIVLTHGLSPNAKAVLSLSPHVLAMEHAEISGAHATRVYSGASTDIFNGLSLWDIGNLVSEVFEP